MEAVMQDFFLTIPKSEVSFFQQFIKKMGWKIQTKEERLDGFIASRPHDVPLNDEEILNELREVRYRQ